MFKEGPRINKAETEVYTDTEKELIKLGDKTGNQLEIVRPQQKRELDLALNPKVVNLEHEGIDSIEAFFNELKNFDNKPIIKDSFNKDNASRREWEADKFFPQASAESVEYYNANLLMKNNLIVVQQFINLAIDFKVVQADKQTLLQEIDQDLDKIINQYDSMEIEEKLQAVEDVGDLVKKLLSVVATSEYSKN